MSIQSVSHIYPSSVSYAYFLACFIIQINFLLSSTAQCGTIADISDTELVTSACIGKWRINYEDYCWRGAIKFRVIATAQMGIRKQQERGVGWTGDKFLYHTVFLDD